MQAPDRRNLELSWLRRDLANNEVEAANIRARLAAGTEHPSVRTALRARAAFLEQETAEIERRLGEVTRAW